MALYRKLALSALCLALLLIAGFGIVDDLGREYTDRGFKRALVTFAVARSLNGVISVAQGTEVAIQPAGIGLNFAPGQILDPINDLVERFSWVMLASSTSLGIQKVLMGIFASPGFTLLLGGALLLLVSLLWSHGATAERMRPLLYKSAIVLLLLRFSIPVVALVSEGVFRLFLEEQYVASSEQIEQTAQAIGHINRSTERAASGLADETIVDMARRYYESATSQMDVQGHI
ncbi:MAG TPA: hypothetical protein VGB35_11960, partial [Gammaproteobacteria bacterium]